MSDRKVKPCSSRRCNDASTSRAGSTTSVVSPYASFTSTRPGVRLKFIPSPKPCERSNPTPRKVRSSVRRYSACHSAELVCRRHARKYLLVQAENPLHQRFGPRWTTRHVDVDRDDLVHALQ